ncbi:MAG: sigma-70 family RNA polymerase sigma factor [Verrucomicrobiae bacterium]|nr:sigma-70 family RNA polymerase sigma factor [Verrucomicrobiae bacterium]
MKTKARAPVGMAGRREGRAGRPPEGPKPKAVAEAQRANPGSGQPDTIEELFAALEGPLLGYALRLVRDHGLAEDLLQEAFLRLHAQLADVREPKRWLYRTVHNLALNQLRRTARIVPLPDPSEGGSSRGEPSEPGPGPDEALARQEQVEQLRRCLGGIDPRSRTLLELKFQEGMSYAQISERMGLTVGHVGYLLHHAIKGLGAAMARSEMTP